MKLTAFNAGIKGKIAGTVFQTSPWGQIMKTTPIDATKSGSKLTRADAGRTISTIANIVKNASAWRSLTIPQRLAWSSAATNFPFKNKWGETYTGSGYQVYMAINTNLLNISRTALTMPPSPVTILNSSAFTVEHDLIDATLVIPSLIILTGTNYVLSATAPMSAGILPTKSLYKIIYNQPASGLIAVNITTDYEDIFGYFPPSGTIHFRLDAVNQTTGQKGTPTFFTLTY